MQFFIYASTFAQMCIAALPDAQTASAVVVLLFAMSLTFNGVMQPPSALPGFWIFMYRVSPFTYWVGGMVSTQVHDRAIVCSQSELSIFDPPSGQTCWQYLEKYATLAGGQVLNKDATSSCEYCSLQVADQFTAQSEIYYSDRWRNFGIVWAFIIFNIFMATVLYYTFRVKKWSLDGIKQKLGSIIPSKKSKATQ
jgi:ABC-type multidrug transport system permease subunit